MTGVADTSAPLLEVQGLSARYALPRAPGAPAGTSWLQAVDGVDLRLARGEALGLVGESGCGKSTLVSLLSRLSDPHAGRILFDGQDIAATPAARAARAPWRHRIQTVFQDPLESLDPRRRAFEAIAAPLRWLHGMRGDALREAVLRVAAQVQLGCELLARRPHALSGGQAARVGIARALAPGPELLILDEPTSALDVSVQAGVLALLDRLRRERGLAMIFVSHDLAVVRLLCQRVLVMQAGRIADEGPADVLFERPGHPHTRELVAAIPGFESLR